MKTNNQTLSFSPKLPDKWNSYSFNINYRENKLKVEVNKDGVTRGLHAGKIVKEVAMVTGGNGGGRPDMAQAGGKQPEKLNDAFAKAHEVIQSQIK